MNLVAEQVDRRPVEPELYTVQETAKVLSLSVPTVYRLIAKKEITAVKLGGRALVARRALDELLRRIGA